MNELDKIKIGFAIALLAGLFTMQPLIEASAFSFDFFTINLKVTLLYWIFVSLLALSVYFYALALIKFEKLTSFFQGFGNWTYAISLLFPPFILTIYIISLLLKLISPIFKSDNITTSISFLLGITSSVFASFLVNKVQAKFKKEGDKQNAERMKAFEINSLKKAKTLFQSSYYDLVFIELWNTLELSFKRAFLQKAIPFPEKSAIKLIEIIKKNNLLPSNLVDELEAIRNLRNKSAHPQAGLSVSKQQAENAIRNTEKILIAIENYSEVCYYCQKEYPLSELEVEEINGDYYACKTCIKEHPDWKNEILSMGMDP